MLWIGVGHAEDGPVLGIDIETGLAQITVVVNLGSSIHQAADLRHRLSGHLFGHSPELLFREAALLFLVIAVVE